MTRAVSAAGLLGRPVVVRGIRLGRATDVVLDRDGMRALGFEVACGDEMVRFLPFQAGRFEDDEISVPSALQLLDRQNLSFYGGRAESFRALRRLPVEDDGRPIGTLADVLLGLDGRVLRVAVDEGGAVRTVAPTGGVAIAGRPSASAA